MPFKYYIVFILVFIGKGLTAQIGSDSLSNLRIKHIKPASTGVQLDSMSIIPESVIIRGLSDSDFSVNYETGMLLLKSIPSDTLLITYRVFPFKNIEIASRYNYDSIRQNFTLENPYVSGKFGPNDRLVDFGKLNYNGSFGRGLSFGNNQDAVVNSTLNLQINGLIGDSLEFTAAISDNNIPIQPEGNTQNLQDFDRIFMQIRKHDWQVSFGDIDIRKSDDRYLNFFKRLQGASFSTVNKFKNGNKNSFAASGAVARGKFARNVVQPLEGNQGPYKLHGNNNEVYFAVLAGTERVYIDGQLLIRGEDKDYVIDYNLAEVTFTPNRMITIDSRIQVEFEYTDRNFLNSVLYVADEFSLGKKWTFNVGLYSNSDAKNSAINQSLSPEQKHFLSTIGNRIDNAVYPSAMPDTLSENKVLYERRDTIVNGITDSIYVFSTDKSVQLYDLAFTQVGTGKGNYVIANGNTNGRVFEWIAPKDGVPSGDWEPVLLLITPKKHLVFSSGISYALDSNTNIRLSGAFSDYDPNTFSSLDKSENKGAALRVDVDDYRPVSMFQKRDLILTSHMNYEHVDKRFRSVETLRPVEFYRDWGLDIINQEADEQLINLNTGIGDLKNNYVRYLFSNYRRDKNFNGIRNAIETRFQSDGWVFDNKFYLTNVNGSAIKGTFFRPSFSVVKKFAKLSDYELGVSFASEKNKQMAVQYDTLLPVSFGFDTWQFSLRSDATKMNHWGISYFTRSNYLPSGKSLLSSEKSDNISLDATLMSNEHRRFKGNVTYRELHVSDRFKQNEQRDKSLLGRAEYLFDELKGFLNGSVFYEMGAGQEQRRDFTYVEVPAGQGYYMWVDYNGDGVPQLDEFEVATFADQKKWVRILTPTSEYIKANYLQFNYNLSIVPERLKLDENHSFYRFIRRFSSVSALQINKKEMSDGGFSFNPFSKPLSDTSLISLNSLFSNTLYFNRASAVWGMDFTQRINSSKAILSYGFESNRLKNIGWRVRYNLSRMLNAAVETNLRTRTLEVPEFEERNYNVNSTIVAPSFTYTYKTKFRATLKYGMERNKNTRDLKETSNNNTLTGEARYSILSSGAISGRVEYSKISFKGDGNTPVGYILLSGLQPGKNLLWHLELTKRLAGNIEMNLQYEGRKPAGAHVIHTGRASLRAIF